MSTRFVAVSGNIGAGKSTLVSYLCSRYGWTAIYEPFGENPYLDDFYADMGRWAFQSQTWFLARKVRIHLDLQEGLLRGSDVIVQDRTLYEDAEIFAAYLAESGLMSARDWDTYQALYQSVRSALRPPDLVIHLGCSVRAIRRRVRQRGRPSEQGIPLAYLRALNGLYERWIDGWTESPVLRWDTERSDYLSDLAHRIDFHRAVERHIR